ncbi:M16 family metallopeptidase [Catalinimonas alkaloidigena]|nr:pitrilysin family protein [Catalinimonas alkaloidigena]
MNKRLLFSLLLMLTAPVWAQTYQLPPFEKFTLKNGITVYLMEQHEVPLISVSMAFQAGAVQDGAQAGLANLTADALIFDTPKYTKAQIEETMDFLGADLSTYATKEAARIQAEFAAKDQDQVFDILKEIVTQPAFNAEELTKRKDRLTQELIQAKESPRRVIGEYYDGFLYGDHPYSHPLSGTRSGIADITRDQVAAFYQQHYHAQNAALAVVGDFSTAQMKKKLQKLFGAWKTAAPTDPALAAPVLQFDQARVLLVNKPDARETTFLIGGPGVPYNHPDYVAIQVVNTVLGGRFTSWLNDALRVNSGLTYGARSGFATEKLGGTFSISTFTANPTTEPAIDLALEVLDSLHQHGIDAETLASAKNYIKGGYPPRYETSSQLANLLTNMFVYGFDASFINQFQRNVDGLTVAKTREVIQKYFPAKNLQFVLIGKADEIRDIAKKYGQVTEKEITAEGF